MIDIALTLADYLIKFFQKRDDNADEYFDRYVTPAYEAAEVVFSDYLNILTTLKRKILEKKEPVELLNFLEKERNRYLSRRMRLRAEIIDRFHGAKSSEELPEFEKGVLGIMMSGVGTFGKTEDETEMHPVTSPYFYPRDYRNKNRILHTLLDLLSDFSSYAIDYDRYLEIIDAKLDYLHMSWQDVINGYSAYKMIVAPTPSNKNFRKESQRNNTIRENLVDKASPNSVENDTNSNALPPKTKQMYYKRDGD